MDEPKVFIRNNIEFFNIAIVVILIIYIIYVGVVGVPTGVTGVMMTFFVVAIGAIGVAGNLINKYPQAIFTSSPGAGSPYIQQQ